MLVTLLAISTSPSLACMYTPKKSPEKIKTAPVAFIGTVIKLNGDSMSPNHRVTFKVQKAIRGVEDGQIYETDGYVSSCHNNFAPFMRYLYLGSHLQSDSLSLESWLGEPDQENIDFVIRETGIKEAGQSLLLKGFIKKSCLPKGNYTVDLELDDHLLIKLLYQVKDEPEKIRDYEMTGYTVSYCPENTEKCSQLKGVIDFNTLNNTEISGQLSLADEDLPAQLKKRIYSVFRAKYTGDPHSCQ